MFLIVVVLLCAAQALMIGAAPPPGGNNSNAFRPNHPGIGSWFGKAVQVCPPGQTESNCNGEGSPAVSLFMTPTFNADGNFLGNDSLALSSAPFGPHTTAHGQWVPTGKNALVADIVFMLNPFPPAATPSTAAVHIKYSATVVGPDTMVGYVNIYFFPPLELSWEALGPDQFPTLPDGVTAVTASPVQVYTDPSQCTAAGCPLVFKFKVQRVAS